MLQTLKAELRGMLQTLRVEPRGMLQTLKTAPQGMLQSLGGQEVTAAQRGQEGEEVVAAQ